MNETFENNEGFNYDFKMLSILHNGKTYAETASQAKL